MFLSAFYSERHDDLQDSVKLTGVLLYELPWPIHDAKENELVKLHEPRVLGCRAALFFEAPNHARQTSN